MVRLLVRYLHQIGLVGIIISYCFITESDSMSVFLLQLQPHHLCFVSVINYNCFLTESELMSVPMLGFINSLGHVFLYYTLLLLYYQKRLDKSAFASASSPWLDWSCFVTESESLNALMVRLLVHYLYLTNLVGIIK